MARHFLAPLLALAFWGAACLAPTWAEEAPEAIKPENQEEYYELYKVFADTLDQVERNYVKGISRRELMEAAIKGVLDKLDPYSSYINPEEISRFKTSVESQFGGIGIQISVDEQGRLTILSPLVGTPAYRAGLLAGDHIVEIEGQTTVGITVDEAVRRLKGEAGTSVTLSVMHVNGSDRQTVTLKREIVRVETVLGDKRKSDDSWDFLLDPDSRIGYIRLTAFSRDTSTDLRKALDELKKQNFRGLVLDLRFNPGGLLTSAIDISDLFVGEGKIVSTEGRNSPARTWDAQKPGTLDGFPMVVLVNRYSASASEIVSACLQDHNRAVIVGERTWGKGSVQNVIELEDGKSALKLTTASYQRPSGKNIHRFPDAKETDEWGVTPNEGFMVQLSDSEMVDLVQYRRARDIVHGLKTTPATLEAPASGETPAPTETPATDKPAPETPATETPAADPATPEAAAEAPVQPVPDRQLQKALDYLSGEFAQAK